MIIKYILYCLIAILQCSDAHAQNRLITSEDFYNIREMADCQISPDGNIVAYVLKRVDKETNRYLSNIWIYSLKKDVPLQLTTGMAEDNSPRWSPDSKFIAFVSNRTGKNQIWMIAIHGGEAWTLTNLESGAYEPTWSPDASKIAFLSKANDQNSTTTRSEQVKLVNGKEYATDVKIIRSLKYRYKQKYFDDNYAHIFVYSLSNNTIKQLTNSSVHDAEPAWSPDGKFITFSSNRNGDQHFDDNSDIFTVPVEGGSILQITLEPGPEKEPFWNSNGEFIYFIGKTEPNNYAMQFDLFSVNYHTKKIDNLTASFDRTILNAQLSPDADKIYFSAPDHGNVHLYTLYLNSGNIEKVITGQRQVVSHHISSKRNILYIATDDKTPGDLYVSSLSGKNEIRLTHVNEASLKNINLSQSQEYYFTGYQNTRIQGWIMRPPDFSPEKIYPLIVHIHGGPHWYYGNSWFQEFQLLAAQGYVVFYCNPRLSTGYGQEFAYASVGEWGKGDFQDIMAGVNHVISLGFVDSTKMGVTGGSYGGFMTNWIIAHSDRFKAAVTQRSISNLISFYGTTDVQSFVEYEFDVPWKNMEKLINHSPITYADRINTPLLIIHSEQDFRVPIGQAEELFTSLKRINVDVEFVRYPDEGHELSRSGQPIHRVDRYNRIIDWFAAYLK